MSEKVLFKSEPSQYVNTQKKACWFLCIFPVLLLIGLISFSNQGFDAEGKTQIALFFFLGILGFVGLTLLCFRQVKGYIGELTVTNERVYGIATNGMSFNYQLKELTGVAYARHKTYREGICLELEGKDIYIYYIADREAAYRIIEKNAPFTLEKFYNKCKSAGIADLDSKANIARLVLFAKNERISKSEQELIEMYQNGQRYAEDRDAGVAKSKKEKELAEAKKREREILAKQTKYIHLTGTAKRRQMYLDEAVETQRSIEKAAQGRRDALGAIAATASAQYSAVAEKESSWGWQAGIANGLAGPGAGLATAINVEAENAQIRARNQARHDAIMSNASSAWNNVYSSNESYMIGCLKEEIKKKERIAEEALSKLTMELPEKELLENINLKIYKAEVTGTGAIYICFESHGKEFKIYDNVRACTDGSLNATINFQGKDICSATFSLPKEGGFYQTYVWVLFNNIPREYDAQLLATSLQNGDENCSIKFSAHHLWAIEIQSQKG